MGELFLLFIVKCQRKISISYLFRHDTKMLNVKRTLYLTKLHEILKLTLFMVILQILTFSADVFKFMLVIGTSFLYKTLWYIQSPLAKIKC